MYRVPNTTDESMPANFAEWQSVFGTGWLKRMEMMDTNKPNLEI
jgi:hypothetical protein